MTNLTRPNRQVVKFYNGRGTAEQWIKEGKNALRWTRLALDTGIGAGEVCPESVGQ